MFYRNSAAHVNPELASVADLGVLILEPGTLEEDTMRDGPRSHPTGARRIRAALIQTDPLATRR